MVALHVRAPITPRAARRSAADWLALGALGLVTWACSPGEASQSPATVVEDEEPEKGNPDDAEPGAPSAPVHAPTASDNVLVEAPPPPFCGDGALNDDEQCDDGAQVAGDGCSANCLVVEQGWQCPTPGSPCAQAAICGDGLQLLDEQCDDGNTLADDGCSVACQIEAGYVCPEPGQPCVSSVICGDGVISGAEQCDDRNAVGGDGCGECQVEPGWECPIAGALCVPVCGDGLVRGLEQCDDGGSALPGCDASCGREPGFVCRAEGQPCQRTVCGDGEVEGDEGCDDENQVPFDGCLACVREPACDEGACGAVCGDGLRFDTEACDDGNVLAGDGCSPTCTIEAGYACVDVGGDGANGTTFVLPVIYRDFIGVDTSGDPQAGARVAARAAANVQQHPDFNTFTGTGVLGAVGPELDDAGKPILIAAQGNFTSAARFAEWYRDDPEVNLPVVDQTLTLTAQEDGSFLFDSLTDSANQQFDPLLGLGFQAAPATGVSLESPEFCVIDQVSNPGATGATPRNMSFTTETRFVFEYVGNERFVFSGDDDVWVFVNNRLVLDLGGLHEVADGEFTLGGTPNTEGLATVQREGPPGSALTLAAPIQIDTGMDFGGVYEVAMFHAERHECGSNFKLTLAGFDKPRSACEEVCGDGVVTRSESCDDGEAFNGSGYNFCSADCTPGPRCGDGRLDDADGEVCDNGLNLDRYSTSPSACGPGCTRPSFCGDGVLDGAFGEQCDDGVNDGSYGGCGSTCRLGPRCGDGATNGPEECDDGNFVNGDGCNLACELEREIIPS